MDFSQERMKIAVSDYKHYLTLLLGADKADQTVNNLANLGLMCARESQRQPPGAISPMDMVLQNLVSLTVVAGTMSGRLTELTRKVADLEKQLADEKGADDGDKKAE